MYSAGRFLDIIMTSTESSWVMVRQGKDQRHALPVYFQVEINYRLCPDTFHYIYYCLQKNDVTRCVFTFEMSGEAPLTFILWHLCSLVCKNLYDSTIFILENYRVIPLHYCWTKFVDPWKTSKLGMVWSIRRSNIDY